jgi:hypothetical protein
LARIHGQRGRLYVGIASSTAAAEPVSFLNSWSMDSATDKAEVTAFEDANKTYVSGKEDASGSFAGFYDNATAQLYTAATDGQARRFYLYPDHTTGPANYWFGTGIFDFSVSGDVGDAVKVSGNWSAASDISKVI